MTPQDVDFADAHRRHWEDAELLYNCERWANADQLYGFRAECGLKAVMRSLGMPAETPGQYRKHVQGLWPIFEDFAKDRDGGRYPDLLPDSKPFSDGRTMIATRIASASAESPWSHVARRHRGFAGWWDSYRRMRTHE